MMWMQDLLLPAVLMLISIALWIAAYKMDASARWPLGFYLAVYGVTTLIGGVLIGVTDGYILDLVKAGINLKGISDFSSFTYWGVLFSPMIVTPLTIILLHDFRIANQVLGRQLSRIDDQIDILSFSFVFICFTGYTFGMLYTRGYGDSITMWLQLQGDFISMMRLRDELARDFGGEFWGVTYIIMPALSFCALYQAIRRPGMAWKFVFVIVTCTNLVLSMSLMQKAPLLIYVLFLGVALTETGVLSIKPLLLSFAGGFVLLTIMQNLTMEYWDNNQTVSHMIFRMPQAYPFYINLYPESLPYTGVDLGLHHIGIGEGNTSSHIVIGYMYPQIEDIDGAAPAPAAVRAYSEAGPIYVVITQVLIGVCIKAIGCLRDRFRGPLNFMIYVQALVFLYYLSQTSLRGAFTSCYGIGWAVIAWVALWICSTSLARHRQRPAFGPAAVTHFR